MADADIARTGLAQAAARLPEAVAARHRLALTDPEFREVCEEYALAQQSDPRSATTAGRSPTSKPRL